jgi:hypothetical protein
MLDVDNRNPCRIRVSDQALRIAQGARAVRNRHLAAEVLILEIDHQQGAAGGFDSGGGRCAGHGANRRVVHCGPRHGEEEGGAVAEEAAPITATAAWDVVSNARWNPESGPMDSIR